jgi:hypothetical protein
MHTSHVTLYIVDVDIEGMLGLFAAVAKWRRRESREIFWRF